MSFLRRLAVVALALLAWAGPALASQGNTWSPTTGTVSGLQLTTNYNGAFQALQSANSGATAPTNDISGAAVKGQLWLDTSTTPACLKQSDASGGGATWVVIGCIDSSTHGWRPPIGGGTDTIASATTTDLGSKASTYLTVSGVTTVTGFGGSAATGTTKLLTFSGAMLLTHSSPGLILPNGGGNITTAVGDTAVAVATGSGNWTVVDYVKADGSALSSASAFTSAVFFNGVISPSNLTSNTNDWAPTGLAAANTIRFSCNASITISGITASATDGKVLLLDNIGATNGCTLSSQDTNSSAANRFALVQPYLVPPLSQIAIRYDLTTARWKLLTPNVPSIISGTYRNLRVFNVATAMGDSAPGTPATMLSIKADALTVEDVNGNARRLNTVSCTIDFTTNGAAGLDTGSLSAPNWYAPWVIYNPTTNATSCVGSLQSSYASVTQPSGYTFAARVGWDYYVTSNALTQLRRIVQYGNKACYATTAATNTNVLPNIANNTAGTASNTAPVYATPSVATIVPTTAASIWVTITAQWNNNGVVSVGVAANAAYLGYASTNPPQWYANLGLNGGAGANEIEIQLEGTTVAWWSGGTGGGINGYCWRDNL